MKKQIFVYATSWDKDTILLLEHESFQDNLIPLGSRMIELGDDLVPESDATWTSMRHSHKVNMAERKIVDARITLGKAEQDLKDLLSIGYTPTDDGYPF
tara:strand:+ start:158 stop:454 length:297 start_codon:yes stop_codon:yes gene_type:complete